VICLIWTDQETSQSLHVLHDSEEEKKAGYYGMINIGKFARKALESYYEVVFFFFLTDVYFD